MLSKIAESEEENKAVPPPIKLTTDELIAILAKLTEPPALPDRFVTTPLEAGLETQPLEAGLETQTSSTQPPSTTSLATISPATQPNATQPNGTQPNATEPNAIEPNATQPNATQPYATQTYAIQPFATQPPTTQPPATQPPATTEEFDGWGETEALNTAGGDIETTELIMQKQSKAGHLYSSYYTIISALLVTVVSRLHHWVSLS